MKANSGCRCGVSPKGSVVTGRPVRMVIAPNPVNKGGVLGCG